MFKTIQFIALLQGLFLLVILFKTKSKYFKPAFWLLVGSIVSILLYIIEDSNYSFIKSPVRLYFLDKSLFITFLFLFVKYHVNKEPKFKKSDLLFFIPNLLYFLVEVYEMTFFKEPLFIEIPELILELTFFFYLTSTVIKLVVGRAQKWMLFITIPLAILVNLDIINDFLSWFNLNPINFLSRSQFNSYTLIIAAFLFYFLTLKLILSPKQILSFDEGKKYKSSGLNQSQIEDYKTQLINLMENEKAFKDSTLSIQTVSEQLKIPRQYVSEILNIHMETNFKDFVNDYRINEFTKMLNDKKYSNYTILGIAKEVGFNSKATFYASFKKIKGATPSEYKKEMELV